MIRALGACIFLLVALTHSMYGQGVTARDNLTVSSTDTVVQLPHGFIIEETLTLTLDSTYTLQQGSDFTLDPLFGLLTFTPAFRAQLANDSATTHTLATEYQYRPFDIPRSYSTRTLVTRSDSTGTEREVAERRTELTATDIFGKDFQRSGSLVRGISVGSNRDLTVQSGLRLQFSGNITDDVEVLGALTDEQTPIQPEGNTQTLREIDNIFIEVRSPYATGTLGKFTAANTTSEYTRFSRKLQGVKATGAYSGYGNLNVVAAVSPGKFRTQEIQGRERDQGPYRLTGPAGERDIIVLAGTERVFVDGIEMVRGESNDYIIDYSTGEVFFQTRKPITSANRIVIDFEYTDRQYSRSFLATSGSGYLLDSATTLTASYIREADDPNAPVDITLTDADRALLASVGNNAAGAIRSGVRFVGRSDTASGYYRRVDTLINGLPDSVFYYAPNDANALYDVSFSIPPDGIGDYRRIAFGQYEYVGKGAGQYLPVIYLPLPVLQQVGAVKLQLNPSPAVTASGELAFSQRSQNRFSTLAGTQLGGIAFNGLLSASGDSIRIGGLRVGALRFTGNAQFLGSQFRTVERLGDVEFGYKWNTESRLGESGFDDLLAEGNLFWQPARQLQFNASGGYLGRGDLLTSLRQEYSGRLIGDSILPAADYTVELIGTDDTLQGGATSAWLKQRGGISYTLGALTPGVRFQHERREATGTAGDTLLPGSFGYTEVGPDLRIDLPFMATTASARFRVDDSLRFDPAISSSRYIRDGESQTYTVRGELRGLSSLSSTLDFTYRSKTYDSVPGADPLRRLDNTTILARSQSRWNGFNRGAELEALYEVQTEQAARLQRVFVRVPVGQGQYIWQDLDSNGIQSEEEFRLTNAEDGEYVRIDLQTDDLFPVIDLRTTARLKLQPKRIFSPETFPGPLLAPVTTETFLRLEEKSQSPNESDMYLLNLSRFQNDSTTLLGNSLIQQDIHLFESNKDYSFRFRYLERRGVTRLVTAIERSEGIERSLRSRWQPTWDIGLQLDLAANSGALRSTETSSNRTYDITTLQAESDFSYRPEQSLELGWKLRVGSTEDVLPVIPRTTLLSSNELRAVYSIETKGRLRVELERTVIAGENVEGETFDLPYQLTEGYAIGTTWVGRISFDYRFGANIQASLLYTGRAQPPSDRVVHTGQAEARAFF